MKEEPLYEEIALYEDLDEIASQLAALPKLPCKVDEPPLPHRRLRSIMVCCNFRDAAYATHVVVMLS